MPAKKKVRNVGFPGTSPKQMQALRIQRGRIALTLTNTELRPGGDAAVVAAMKFQDRNDAPTYMTVACLLADLAHWCDSKGTSFADAMVMAKKHYDEETNGKGTQIPTVL